jgi:hypothetical protein
LRRKRAQPRRQNRQRRNQPEVLNDPSHVIFQAGKSVEWFRAYCGDTRENLHGQW